MNVIPSGVCVTPFERKISGFDVCSRLSHWYSKATAVLRGGDGGEHGLLLYNLVAQCGDRGHPLVLLDVGTARGFSAMVMARSLLDARISGHVYTVDIFPHDELRDWHIDKHAADDPLVNQLVNRSEIWHETFDEESGLVTPLTGRSIDILSTWDYGEIDLTFLDGEHTYDAVQRELYLLGQLMAPGGTIVLDDYHTGIPLGEVRSQALNGLIRAVGAVMRSTRISLGERMCLGTGTALVVSVQRYAGVRKAVYEFVARQPGEWSLEIVTMPSRGAYQGTDYALAVLTRGAG